MAQGRAIGIVVLYIAWAGAAFGAPDPSRDDVVRALMQRSRLIDDVQFQLPVEIYRRYLAETAARPAKPPTAFIIEQGRYGVTLGDKNHPSLRVELSVRVLDSNQCREIPVLRASLAWDKITLNGQASKLGEKDGWLQLMPDKAGVYSIVADVKLGQAWADKARITLAASPSVRTIAKFDAPGTWRVSAGGSSHASDTPAGGGTHVEIPLVPSNRIDISWTRAVVLPPRPVRYELNGAIAWNIDAGRQQIASRMNVRILGRPTDRLRLSIPPGALKCKITGSDVREMQLSGGSVVVFLRGPVTGQTRLDVSYELPIGSGAEKPLAAPAVADGHWSSGTVVVTDTAGASELIAGDIRGLREIHESEIPADARAILAGKPVLAYAITSRNFDASVEVLDLGEFALRESIADAAHYQVLLRPDGSLMCKIDYEIRNRTRQFLRVHLPVGSRVLSARVNDVPKSLTPVAGETGAFLLPLVRSNASVKGLVSFPVQVVVLYRAAALGKRGLAELPLPTIDLPIAYGWCDLYAPAGMKVRQWGGPMRKVEQFSSETAVASLSYGSAELAEGYKPEDRVRVVTAPKPKPKLASGVARWLGATLGAERPEPAPTAQSPSETPVAQTRPAQARPQGDARYASRLNLLKAPDTPEPRKPGQGQPAPTMIIDQQQQLDTTVTVSSGGTLLLGGQSLLAGNYYRAGKDYYDKGEYAKAAESLSNVRRMAPKSVEATNAGRLLANIDVIHGKAKTASRQEKALGKKVQAEIGGQNLDLEQRQSRLLEQAGEALKSKDLARAQASYKAAEGLGYKLLAKGSSKTEQKVRMTKAREQLKRLDEQQKGQTQQLRRQYQQLKSSGDVQQALEVGNALQRLSDEKDEKTALRGELEKLAIASVQMSARAEKADKLDSSAGQWKAESGKVKVGAGLVGFAIKSTSGSKSVHTPVIPSPGSARFGRGYGDYAKDAPVPPPDGGLLGTIRITDRSAFVNVNAPTGQAEPAAERSAIEAPPGQRVYGPAHQRGRVVTRTYDVRELVIDSDGEQTAEDIARRGKELERNIRGTLGEGRDKDSDGLRDDLRVVDGKLIVTADLGGQRQVGSLLKKLGDIRGPQVEMGSNIAGQQASGLVNGGRAQIMGGISTGVGTSIGPLVGPQARSTNGTFLDDTQVDFLNGRVPHQPTEASKAQFEDYIRRNYKWAFSEGRPGEKDRTGGGGGGGSGAWGRDSDGDDSDAWTGAAIPRSGRIRDREKVIKDLSEKLSKNLWQDVTVNSRNIGISAGDASQLGIRFTKGVNNVNFATVDEAQLRTLRQIEAQRGGRERQVDANPRLQETIVGTEALLAGGQRAYIANAGESSNTLDLAGNPIVLSHEKYVLIDAGGFVTAVKAGEMQHWTQAVREEDVGFADVPQELDLPRVGELVKFEKTLIRPADRLTIRADYTWK